MKAALIGLEHPHAMFLLRTLQNLPEVEEIFVGEESTAALRRHRLPDRAKVALCTRNLDTLLSRGDIAFAVVCVRNDLAAGISERVIAAGIPLLAEKPGGLTAAELRRLLELAERREVRAAVLYGQRAHPAVREMRRMITAGEIGGLMSVEARMVTTQVCFRDPRSWLFRRSAAGGGVLTWLGCHYLDLMAHVTGDEIATVSAHLATRSGAAIDVEDVAALSFQFSSGAIGTLHAGYLLAHSGQGYRNRAGFDNYLALNGRAGRVVWRGVTKQALLVETPPRGGRFARRTRRFRQRTTDSYGGATGEDFVRQFIRALRGEAELPATLSDAWRTVLVIEAAQRSARSGRAERVNARSSRHRSGLPRR